MLNCDVAIRFPYLLSTLALELESKTKEAHFKHEAHLGWSTTMIIRRKLGKWPFFGQGFASARKSLQTCKCSGNENFHRSDKRWEQTCNYQTFHQCILPDGANELDGRICGWLFLCLSVYVCVLFARYWIPHACTPLTLPDSHTLITPKLWLPFSNHTPL